MLDVGDGQWWLAVDSAGSGQCWQQVAIVAQILSPEDRLAVTESWEFEN